MYVLVSFSESDGCVCVYVCAGVYVWHKYIFKMSYTVVGDKINIMV